MNSYNFERLADEIYVAVSKKHTFGTDAILLASFSHPLKSDLALDMGTGCGIIPLLWLKYDLKNPIECFDIQESAIEQVKYGISRSNAEEKINARCADLRDLSNDYRADSFTLVTMNPPYKTVKSGQTPKDENIKISKTEMCCNIEDVAEAASKLLKVGGRFCLCHRPERLIDVIITLRKNNLEPKRLRFVTDKPGDKPFLFLLESKKCSKPFLSVEKELYIKDANGNVTEEILEIYGNYAEGYDT